LVNFEIGTIKKITAIKQVENLMAKLLISNPVVLAPHSKLEKLKKILKIIKC
jgi:hypothetical protein